MDLIIAPTSGLRGAVAPPANKSHSFRALLAAGLADGVSTIRNPAVSNDWRRGVRALELFGAKVESDRLKTCPTESDRLKTCPTESDRLKTCPTESDRLKTCPTESDRLETCPGNHADAYRITGLAGRPATPDDVIDCGNSGLILRFFTAAAALCPGYTVLTGDESIRHIRPVGPLLDGLNQLGAFAVSTKSDGRAPVVVRGPLRGGLATIDGADSQYISALLLAVAAAGVQAEIRVTNPGERPWVAMTLHWLARLGVRVECENFERYRLFSSDPKGSAPAGPGPWPAFDFTVPADWSAALYPLAAALLTEGSEVTVTGVDPADPQPDRLVLDVLGQMGGDIEIGPDRVTARSSRLTGRRIDCNDFIDQFMLMAVVGCLAEGETELVNAEIARHKECDRIAAMANALRAMGADLDERPDGLLIRKSALRGADLDSLADHRMVMTLTVAALASTGRTTIRRAECVEKTFADFPSAMAGLGADVRVLAD